jgi:hypothetical protein
MTVNMTVRMSPRVDRMRRTAITGWYLAVHTIGQIVAGVRYERRDDHARTLPVGDRLRRLARLCRYYIGCAADPRTFFVVDADRHGRRRSDVDRTARRHRRVLADLRRRHVSMLLRALGDSAADVEATLTRNWQRHGDERTWSLFDDYLVPRLRWRERTTYLQIDVHPWATNVSGVWVATPAPVRRYLRCTVEHEGRLDDAYTRRLRRGVLPAPEPHAP